MTPEQWAQLTPEQQSRHVAQHGPPPQHYPASSYATTAVATATPGRKRRVWPWVLLAVVLIPVLLFAGCVALVGGAAKSIDDARQGGTVKIGETFTYASGLALTVAAPKAYDADNEFIVDPRKESAYEATVTITNGTKDPVGAALITINATVASAPAEQVFTDNPFPSQQIAPGQNLAIPFRFKVKKGTKGPLQIAVTDTFNQPAFFTGVL